MSKRIGFFYNGKWLVGLLALVTLVGTLWFTREFGAGLTPDSAAYISTAKNMLAGRGLILFDGSPLTVWPPLYPFLLAATQLVSGTDAIVVARFINAVLYALIVFLSGLLFLRHLKSRFLALLATVSVALSATLLEVVLMAWSEPLFIFLVLLFLLSLDVFETKRHFIWLLVAALAAGLAAVTRYIGVILIPMGLANVLLLSPSDLKTKLRSGILFLFVALIPTGLWSWRNYLLIGMPFGGRGISRFTIDDNLSLTFDTILNWFVNVELVSNRFLVLILGIIVGICIGWVVAQNFKESQERIKRLVPTVMVLIGYLVFLNYSSSTMNLDPIDDRLLAPIYVPLAFLIFLLLDWLAHSFVKTWTWRWGAWLVVVLVGFLWLGYLAGTYQAVWANYFRLRGWGYNSGSWRASEMARFIRENPSSITDCQVYSNGSDALYVTTGVESRYPPDKSRSAQMNDLLKRAAIPYNGQICLVWFDGIRRAYLLTPEELQVIVQLTQTEKLRDGAIYRMDVK